MTPNWTWARNSQKYPVYPKLAQFLVCFALRLAISEIQGRQKSAMHHMTPKQTWTLNSQKYSITQNTYHRDQILVRFALWLAVSKSRSSKIWNTGTPNDPKLNLNT